MPGVPERHGVMGLNHRALSNVKRAAHAISHCPPLTDLLRHR
jgi:hypothetical protein